MSAIFSIPAARKEIDELISEGIDPLCDYVYTTFYECKLDFDQSLSLFRLIYDSYPKVYRNMELTSLLAASPCTEFHDYLLKSSFATKKQLENLKERIDEVEDDKLEVLALTHENIKQWKKEADDEHQAFVESEKRREAEKKEVTKKLSKRRTKEIREDFEKMDLDDAAISIANKNTIRYWLSSLEMLYYPRLRLKLQEALAHLDNLEE